MVVQGAFMKASDICRPWWLIPTNFSKTAHISADFQAFLQRPMCRKDLKFEDRISQHIFCESLSEVPDRVLSTDVDSVLQDKHALLQPCQWETVQITHASKTLYSVVGNDQKIRFMVTLDHEVEIFQDKLVYNVGTLVNNICGFFGVYMGIGVLELMTIIDRVIMLYFKGKS
jgi:hypothetical protein